MPTEVSFLARLCILETAQHLLKLPISICQNNLVTMQNIDQIIPLSLAVRDKKL